MIDEVQKIPELLNEVHRQIETHRRHFVLTESSLRKLRKEGVNLLAGRALLEYAFPLTSLEMKSDFNIKQALEFGTLPGVTQTEDHRQFLKSYLVTYLKEEVEKEGLTKHIPSFARFLEAASFSQASILNMTSVGRDCSIEKKVVESYFQILEDILIGIRLPIFQRRAKRRVTQHPKFFFFDCGVFRAIRPTGPLDEKAFIDGAAFETLIFQELRALNHYLRWEYDLFTWRTTTRQEVDFILYGPGGMHAIEVKNTTRIRDEDLSGLQLFLEDYPMAMGWLIYRGAERRYYGKSKGKIELLPVELFMGQMSEFVGPK